MYVILLFTDYSSIIPKVQLCFFLFTIIFYTFKLGIKKTLKFKNLNYTWKFNYFLIARTNNSTYCKKIYKYNSKRYKNCNIELYLKA